MKIKLLPLISLTAVSAITLPLVVSCKEDEPVEPQTQWYQFDGKDVYLPKYGKAVGDETTHPDGYDDDAASKLYFDDLYDNNDIFLDDMLNVTSINLFLLKLNHSENESYFNIALEMNNVDKTNKKLSFKIKGSYLIDRVHADQPLVGLTGSNSLDPSQFDYVNVKSFDVTFTNVPFYLFFDSDSTNNWFLYPNNVSSLPEGAKIECEFDGYGIYYKDGAPVTILFPNATFDFKYTPTPGPVTSFSTSNISDKDKNFIAGDFAQLFLMFSPYHMGDIVHEQTGPI